MERGCYTYTSATDRNVATFALERNNRGESRKITVWHMPEYEAAITEYRRWLMLVAVGAAHAALGRAETVLRGFRNGLTSASDGTARLQLCRFGIFWWV